LANKEGDLRKAPTKRRPNKAGLCSRCGEKAMPGLTVCNDHLELDKAARKRFYLAHKINGLCVKCGKKAISGSVVCEEHLEKQRGYQREHIQTRRNAGLCLRCEEEAIPGFAVCKSHFDVQRMTSQQHYLDHKNAGLCIKCGDKPAPDLTVCKKHQEMRNMALGRYYRAHSLEISNQKKARYERYKLEGKCVTCGSLLTRGESVYCTVCRNNRNMSRRKKRTQIQDRPN
jgi:hypothetical protein